MTSGAIQAIIINDIGMLRGDLQKNQRTRDDRSYRVMIDVCRNMGREHLIPLISKYLPIVTPRNDSIASINSDIVAF